MQVDDETGAVSYSEPNRPGSRLTGPNATDQSVRLAQYVRASGLRGIAVLNRGDTSDIINLSAKGTGTRPFPFDSRGSCPSERMNFLPVAEDVTLGSDEMRQVRRYRYSMKAEAFAASMQKEAKARERNYWREAFPYWPLNADGSFESGKIRTNPRSRGIISSPW